MHKQKGQVILITLLVMSFAVTVALSLIARGTTDLALTNQTEESAKAFSAAEAGIEAALKSGIGTTIPQTLSSGGKYEVAVVDIGGGVGVYELPRQTETGDTETVWLVAHNDDGTLNETGSFQGGTLNLCWTGSNPVPALVTTIIYKRGGEYYAAKGAYDPDNGRRASNKFSAPTALANGCGQSAMYSQTLSFLADFDINPASDILIMLRVRPEYNQTRLAFDSGDIALPLQGKRVESVGTTGSGITRKIVVYKHYRAASTIFDAALYSQGNLIK